MPLLKHIIGETFVPKSQDEKDFVAKHVVKLFKNIYAEKEYDKLFKGTNIKAIDRTSPENHGYNPGQDEKVYESVEDQSFALHESSLPHLDHLMNFSHRYSAKNGHVMGHVAHAAAMTAKDHGLWVHDVESALDKNQSGIFGTVKGDKKLGLGNKKIAKMNRGDARKLVKDTFYKHLTKAKKTNPTFHHQKFSKVLHGVPFATVKESFVRESLEGCGDHWDAIKHVAKKHAVNPSLVAAALLSHYTQGKSRDADQPIAFDPKPYGPVRNFQRDYHDYLEDKKRGIHEHSTEQSDSELLLQDQGGTSTPEISESDARREFIRRSLRRSLSEDDGSTRIDEKRKSKKVKCDDDDDDDEEEKEKEREMKEETLSEKSPPGKSAENWIKANKSRFIKQYGEEKGKEILYAKAWKLFGETVNLEEKYYVQAHYSDGTQKLGNLDGQSSLSANYKKTSHYKNLKSGSFKASNQVHHWKIVDSNNKEIEKIMNPNYKEKQKLKIKWGSK